MNIQAPDLQRLHQDWDRRRRGREFPARADFDPLDLKYILGSLSLIDVLRDPLRFRIRLHATNIVDRAGLDLTGKLVDEMPEDRRKVAVGHYRDVIDARAPIVRLYEHRPLDERMWDCEVLVLPLGSNGTDIDMLMSAFVWNSEP